MNDNHIALRDHLGLDLDRPARLLRLWNRDRQLPWLIKWGGRGLRLSYRWGLYLLSLVHSFDIQIKMVLDGPMLCRLPEHWYYLFFGWVPDLSEVNFARWLIKNLKPGDIFLDVGANNGVYTRLAKLLVGAQGEVHAFEPTPQMFRLLEINAHGERIHLNPIALADTVGTAKLYLHPTDSAENSLIVAAIPAPPPPHNILVTVSTLDAYCEARSLKPTVIKIDVEQAEDLVVKGGSTIWQSSSPMVSVEVTTHGIASHLRAADVLGRFGYRAYRIDEYGELSEFTVSSDSLMQLVTSGEQKWDNLIYKKPQVA